MSTQYKYIAHNKQGKTEEGTLYAANHAAAVADLNGRGLTPVKLVESAQSEKHTGVSALFYSLPFVNRVKTQDKVVFSRQLATMITAGVPIGRALNILEQQSESPKIKEMAADLARQVEGGQSLAKAMASHPEVISHVYVSMVRAGETGGILDEVLDRLAEQEEKDAELKSRVKSAMLYPAVVSIATVVAFFFLMIVIVPKLSSIFSDLGTNMPVYTRIMLDMSNFMVNYWFVIVAAAIALIIVFRLWHAMPAGKRTVDRALLVTPIFGRIIIKVNIARFARTFSSLMYAGTPLLDALDVTREALNNSIYREEISKIAAQVKNGRALSEEIRDSKRFPPIVSQMIAIGEETGKLNEVLLKLATFYEREVDAVVSGLTSVIEPLLILVLGGMVGFLAVSVLGPISSISQAI
jgi:type IV pilus assembly protein PilC